MKHVKRVLRIVIGIIFAALSFLILREHQLCAEEYERIARQNMAPEQLPDYDYISEIRRLMQDRHYGEAAVLCEDVCKLGLPCAAEAAVLSAEIEKESKNIWNRLFKSGRAFITGNPDGSIEEIGGSVASDMIMYGDIRDLAKQGWFKITGRETDPLIVALSGIGLVTEFIDVADWAPAALKAMKKAGVFTGKLSESLLVMCRRAAATRKLDKPTREFFLNSKNMLDHAGFIRTKNMFKNVEHADELVILAQKSRINPELTHLVSRHAGRETGDLLKNHSPAALRQIARKGRLAVRLVKSYHKHKAAVSRTFWANVSKESVNAISSTLGIIGLALVISGIVPWVWRRRKKGDAAPS